MKWYCIFLCSLCLSCIPVRLAPKIEDYKITLAKRFKKDLPKTWAFVFEDSKEADEFYHFINARFALENLNVETNVPLVIDQQTFYMSFYERERITETGNLIPILVDGILQNQGVDPLMEDAYSSRSSHWYILLVVHDADFADCLAPGHPYRKQVIVALRDLKDQYQTTHNYRELFFTKD